MTVPAPSRIQLPDAPADQQAVLAAGGVACWEDVIEIDTYEPAAPDRYPHFLDRRVYQGSSGKIYPMPMTDAVAHEKAPRAWRAIHLENRFVRLLLLPEIGGRIHIGYDKVAGYDFFYRNNVIKPALVGLGGPWISGGIEFNWPQHHRPGTYLPVDARIEREDDGAVVVWHSDLDPLQRMRGTHGIRLRPESSLIEADVRLHNRTDVTQTFLWWANVAAAAHERYQSFFPDDVAFVADHARRAITAFPRADRAYYGVDYPALAAERADADRIDFYSNIPVPTSYMITDTEDDFFGGYDHRADAGFVHWADRAISPGKKQWTWGDGPIGRAWDAQLTDSDGPYVELMAGVYTDNQPDFAWLVPGETKTFRQYWYPIHAIGPARQATREAAVALGGDADGRARIGVLATAEHADVTVRAVGADGDLATWTGAIGPSAPYTALLDAAADDVREIVVTAGGRELVRWVARSAAFGEPWVATVPPMPEEIAAADELVQTATHLTQNRHPSRSAEPYLRAVLDRDPSDTRAATALAARKLAAGEYAEAVDLLEAAMTRLTSRNLNPRDGEAGHLLGLAYERLGRLADADRAFARAGWNAAFAPAAAIARARIALRRGAARDALELLQPAASVPAAGPLRVLALRLLGDDAAAATIAEELRDRDPLDPMVQALFGAVRTYDPRTALDIASELARAGRYDAAFAATADIAPVDGRAAFAAGGPVANYLRAHWAELAGDTDRAAAERTAARAADTTYAFPAGLDAFDALSAAIAADPHDAVARGLRGMWLLDAGRTTDAHDDLVAATDHGATDAVTWRNLALSTVAVTDDLDAADAAFVRALELSRDARLVFERDVLARVRGLDTAARRTLLDSFDDLLLERDDLAVEHVGLLLDEGRLDDAEQILRTRSFRPFEGGEGRVIALFDRADAERARLLLDTDPSAAASRLADGIDAPANLGEGRHPADPIAERLYLLGEAHAAAGDTAAATAAWQRATAASPLDVAPRPADERDLWIGLALHRLGHDAGAVWERLEARADELEREKDIVDYFATSVPELLLFDVDTSGARTRAAAHLRSLAARGRTETAR